MNTFVRLVSFVLVIAGLQACGHVESNPYGYGGGYHRPAVVPDRLSGYRVETMPQGRAYVATLNPDRTWTVDMNSSLAPGAAAPAGLHTAYRGHDKMWRINGNAVPDRLVVMSHRPQGFDGAYVQVASQPGSVVDPLPAISAETALKLIAKMDARPDPCSSKEHNWNVTVGTFIGGLAVGIASGDPLWALVGALAGASGGSSRSQMSCDRYTAMYLVLHAKVDAAKARCKSTLSQRETNGVLDTTKTKECTAIEAMDFERIGQAQPRAAAALPTPAPAASASRRSAPPANRQWDGTGTPPSWVK